jgi:hypothetical protein
MKHIDLIPFIGKAMTNLDWEHLMFLILFSQRKNHPSFAQSLVQKAVKHRGLNAEHPDPLLTLLGFTKENLPQMTHTFNSTMGHLFETLVRVILKISNHKLYSDVYTEPLKLLTPEEVSKFKKLKPDCTFGKSAIEIKYRYASSEGLTKQKNAYLPLKRMGFKPVMLFFRRSRNSNGIRNFGWEVYEGQGAIEYIHERTGYDINHIISLAGANPVIKMGIKRIQEQYDAQIRATLETEFKWSLNGHREAVHKLIAEDDDSRREFLEDNGIEDKILQGFLGHILKEGDAILNDDRITSIAAELTKNSNNQSFSANLDICEFRSSRTNSTNLKPVDV